VQRLRKFADARQKPVEIGTPGGGGQRVKPLAGTLDDRVRRRRLRRLVVGGAEGLEAGFDAAAAGLDDGFERVAAEGQGA